MRLLMSVLLGIASMQLAIGDVASKLIPGNTYVVIVGVLTWEQGSLTKYPAKRRQDVALYQQFLALGVPEENMAILLDQAATREAIDDAVSTMAQKAKPGSTLIVYYAGHGMTNGNEGIFACYDIRTDRMQQTGWRHSVLTSTIKTHFRGARALLFADCCFSGTLRTVANDLSSRGLDAASVTSASAANTSTNNWTFTHSLVEAFGGHPLADDNLDGTITLGETADQVRRAMKFYEHQSSGFATVGISADFQLAPTQPDTLLAAVANKKLLDYHYGQFVASKIGGKWKPSRVLKIKSDESGESKLLVQFQAYSQRPANWVPAKNVRQLNAPTLRDAPPQIISDSEAKGKASLDGKLTVLLKKIEVESDWRSYGAFRNFGKWAGGSYANHRNLPAGHWVYVYPNWYIWQLSPNETSMEVGRLDFADRDVVVPDWDAMQIIGQPDTLQPGDQVTAWAPSEMDSGKAWVELDYDQEMAPTEIRIHESCGPGAVYQVTAMIDGIETVLWKGSDPTPNAMGMGTSIIPVSNSSKFKTIRIYLNCQLAPGWNEIDAVEMVNAKQESRWAVNARASSTYNQRHPIPFVDPFQTEEDRIAEESAIVQAKIQTHTETLRKLETAAERENETIDQLQEELMRIKRSTR